MNTTTYNNDGQQHTTDLFSIMTKPSETTTMMTMMNMDTTMKMVDRWRRKTMMMMRGSISNTTEVLSAAGEESNGG